MHVHTVTIIYDLHSQKTLHKAWWTCTGVCVVICSIFDGQIWVTAACFCGKGYKGSLKLFSCRVNSERSYQMFSATLKPLSVSTRQHTSGRADTPAQLKSFFCSAFIKTWLTERWDSAAWDSASSRNFTAKALRACPWPWVKSFLCLCLISVHNTPWDVCLLAVGVCELRGTQESFTWTLLCYKWYPRRNVRGD